MNTLNKFFQITICFTSGVAFGQTFDWAKGIGGNQNEVGSFIAADAGGNIYTVGEFEETVDFNPGSASFPLTSKGNNDLFVQKSDAAGNFIWAKAIGGIASDFATGAVLDAQGNVYVTGTFGATADFDPGSGVYVLNSAGVADVFVLKLNPMGELVWAHAFGGSGNDYGNFINIDGAGNLLVTGHFEGTADFDPGSATTNLASNGGFDVFVFKLTPSGSLLWAESCGGSSDDFGYSITADASGNVVTGGYFNQTVDFDPGSAVSSYTATGGLDAFLLKLNASGGFIWARTFGGNYADAALSVLTDDTGNIYSSGFFNDVVDFDPGIGTSDFKSAGLNDVFIHKMSPAGDYLWTKTFGGISDDRTRGLKMDGLGNLYVAGIFYQTADFDPGAGSTNISSLGSSDNYILKLDKTGTFEWVVTYGGVDEDQLFELCVDASNNIYTTGAYRGTADFNPGSGTAASRAVGENDIFIQKITQKTANVPELGLGIAVVVYPNPSNGLVHVSFEQPLNDLDITLSDIHGNVIYSRHCNLCAGEKIPLTGGDGFYFLTLRTQGAQRVIKLVNKSNN